MPKSQRLPSTVSSGEAELLTGETCPGRHILECSSSLVGYGGCGQVPKIDHKDVSVSLQKLCFVVLITKVYSCCVLMGKTQDPKMDLR